MELPAAGRSEACAEARPPRRVGMQRPRYLFISLKYFLA